ncbi:hypothetical protein BKA63DRAFT_295531 [Paraphoma chrysanthemicola]|nr:hypothetical protein BKA63DRAFT_295531 [Paraphoma chrysanthemicola]
MCVSAIATPLPVRALITTTYTNGASSSYYEDVVNDRSTISNMTTMTRGTAVADPLYVAWEATDLSKFPIAYATSLAQKIGLAFTPTATPSTGVSSRPPSETGPLDGGPLNDGTKSDSDSQSGGMSSGTKIGIGVGVGVGASLLIALVAMAFIVRRLRRRNQAVTTYPNESTPAMAGEDAGVVKQKWYQRAKPNEEVEMNNGGANELDSFPVHYVPGPPVELDGSQVHGQRY